MLTVDHEHFLFTIQSLFSGKHEFQLIKPQKAQDLQENYNIKTW